MIMSLRAIFHTLCVFQSDHCIASQHLNRDSTSRNHEKQGIGLSRPYMAAVLSIYSSMDVVLPVHFRRDVEYTALVELSKRLMAVLRS